MAEQLIAEPWSNVDKTNGLAGLDLPANTVLAAPVAAYEASKASSAGRRSRPSSATSESGRWLGGGFFSSCPDIDISGALQIRPGGWDAEFSSKFDPRAALHSMRVQPRQYNRHSPHEAPAWRLSRRPHAKHRDASRLQTSLTRAPHQHASAARVQRSQVSRTRSASRMSGVRQRPSRSGTAAAARASLVAPVLGCGMPRADTANKRRNLRKNSGDSGPRPDSASGSSTTSRYFDRQHGLVPKGDPAGLLSTEAVIPPPYHIDDGGEDTHTVAPIGSSGGCSLSEGGASPLAIRPSSPSKGGGFKWPENERSQRNYVPTIAALDSPSHEKLASVPAPISEAVSRSHSQALLRSARDAALSAMVSVHLDHNLLQPAPQSVQERPQSPWSPLPVGQRKLHGGGLPIATGVTISAPADARQLGGSVGTGGEPGEEREWRRAWEEQEQAAAVGSEEEEEEQEEEQKAGSGGSLESTPVAAPEIGKAASVRAPKAVASVACTKAKKQQQRARKITGEVSAFNRAGSQQQLHKFKGKGRTSSGPARAQPLSSYRLMNAMPCGGIGGSAAGQWEPWETDDGRPASPLPPVDELSEAA